MDNLNLASVFTSFNSRCDGQLQLKSVVAAYDLYEKLVERLLADLTAMMVNLTCSNGRIVMNIQMGCISRISPDVLEDISLPGDSLRWEITDEDIILDMTITEGGAGL